MEIIIDKEYTLRPAEPTDQAFFDRLYHALNAGLLPAGAEQLIASQQQLQAQAYLRRYPQARYLVLERDGVPVGRAVVDFGDDDVHLIDLGLMPAAQGSGGASHVLRHLQRAAAERGCDLTLMVPVFKGGARRLYAAHGFVEEDGDGVFGAMRWRAPQII